MMIPHQNEILHLYRCPGCGKMYEEQTGSVRVSCLVDHSPGSCCHHNEKEISEETMEKENE